MHVPAAVLFDMDGLLVDTEPVWTIAEHELASDLGGVFTPDLKAQIVGTRLEVAVVTQLAAYGAPTTPERVARASQCLLDRMVELFAQGTPVMPGATELVKGLRAEGIPVALVSSSYRVLVDAVLKQVGLDFDLTLAGDEVTQGKPHPEPYLTAASRLGVEAADCVVLEDSPSGVASGEAAGCAVVAVASVPGVVFARAPRRLVVRGLEQIGVQDLADLGRR